MKTLLVLLFISLSFLCNAATNDESCFSKVLISGKDDCFKTKLQNNEYRCCYETYKVTVMSVSTCQPVTKEEYFDIANFIKKRQITIPGFTGYSLDCASRYFTLSIISLIFLVL